MTRSRQTPRSPPLVVDLDGTLIQTDLLLETLLSYLGAYPFRMSSLASALSHGKAPFKAEIARYAAIEPAEPPLRRAGPLAHSASARQWPAGLSGVGEPWNNSVRDVAGHLGLFTGWFASTDGENLIILDQGEAIGRSLWRKGL